MRALLEALGATVYALPVISIEPPEDQGPLDEAVRNLQSYDWVVFSSQNAVEAVFDRLSTLGLPARFSDRIKVAALGPTTAAALTAEGVSIDCQSARATGRDLAKDMGKLGLKNQRILLPQGDLARPDLRTGLEEAGARVQTVVAYRTAQPIEIDVTVLDSLRRGEVDAVAFASPSAVRNLVEILGPHQSCLRRAWLACIGPTTADQLKEFGFKPAATAAEHTSEGLVQAIAQMTNVPKMDASPVSDCQGDNRE